ncbi:MAG: glycosyltransferase [Bacteroidota bacterium]
MSNNPLVSVICLCYNHAEYVLEAIRSVWNQSYKNIELIVVDDGSTDESKVIIEKELKNSKAQFVSLNENVGMCAAFNFGLHRSSGQFIIDLAADDILLEDRIGVGVEDFKNNGNKPTVHFSDAWICDINGEKISSFYQRDTLGNLLERVPYGDIYLELITSYFICAPTMMIHREILEFLKGYDEDLVYEDFDFWIRSSRHFPYIFNDTALVKKRVLQDSDSTNQFALRNKHSRTTLKVCQKISNLNKSQVEDSALVKRCYYEIRLCFKSLNLELIFSYLKLIFLLKRRISTNQYVN